MILRLALRAHGISIYLHMEYRNIIFDFDGTLVDTAAVIVETMRRTISAMELPEKTESECRSMIGYRLEEIPNLLWPDIPGISERYVETYRNIFSSIKDDFKVSLYPEVARTLSLLHDAGVQMAIASSRSNASLREYVYDLGIAGCFQKLVGGEDVNEGKPSPEPVNNILSSQQWDKGKTLVVGDMDVDILMGNRAGADTCGVTYGNGSIEELKSAKAKFIISDFSELLEIVKP